MNRRAASEDPFKELVEKSLDAMFTLDLAGRITYVSSAIERIGGYKPEEMVDNCFLNYLPESGRPAAKDAFARVINGSDLAGWQFNLVRKDGSAAVMEVNASPILREGKVVGCQGLLRDVTERRRVEEALLEREALLRALIDNCPFEFWAMDGSLRYTMQNATSRKNYGDVVGKRIEDLDIPSEVKAQWVEQDKKVLNGEILHEDYWREMGGEKRVFENLVAPIIADESIVGIVGIGMDVTERKRAEEAYRVLVDKSLQGLLIILDGRVVFANEAIAKMIGYSVEEVLAWSPEEVESFVHPDDRELVWSRYRDRLNGKGVPAHYEFRAARKDGSSIWLYMYASLIEYQGKPAVQAAVFDITERKKAEDALRESEEKFRILFNSASDAIFIHDLEGHFFEVNQAACDRLGYTRDELVQMMPMDIDPPEHAIQVPDRIEEVIRLGHKVFESAQVRRDGTLIPVEMNARLIDYKGCKAILCVSRDITERKYAEEALRESERRLADIIAFLPDATFVIDREKKVIAWNRAMEEMTGVGKEDIIGKGDYAYAVPFYGEPRPILIDLVNMQDGETESKYAFIERNGRSISAAEIYVPSMFGGRGAYLWGTASPLYNTKGEIIGSIESIRDITDRKIAESRLREIQRQQEALLNDIPDLAWLKDLDSRYIAVNEPFGRSCGLAPEEVAGKTDLDIWPRHLAEKYRQDDFEVIRSRQRKRMVEPLIDTAGIESWMETIKTPIFDERGDVIGTVGIARDVTERKQLEEALLAAEKRLSTAFLTMVDGMVIVDQDGQIIYSNPAAEDILCLNKNSIQGRHYSELEGERIDVGGERYPLEKLPLALALDERQEVKACELGIKFDKGKPRWLSINAAPLEDGNGLLLGAIASFRDITERKHAEERLKCYSEHLEDLVDKKSRQLRDAERKAAIGETAVMIGHDLRNPLQAIVTTTYLAQAKMDKILQQGGTNLEKQSLQDDLRTIEKQSEYMNKIVSDLQDYARPLRPEMVEIGLLPFVKDSLSGVRIPESVEVQMEIEEGLSWKVDPTMMERVLTNLVTNALQAMPHGGRLTIDAARTEEEVVLTIKDTGEGIHPKNLPKIFDPLFTTKAKGMGLGLVVVKRLLESQGGNINIDSEVGKGTVVVIRMPYEKS